MFLILRIKNTFGVKMLNNQKITEKFNSLITDLNTAISPTGLLDGDFERWINRAEAARIRIEALNLIKRVIGETSDHYKFALEADVQKDHKAPLLLLGALKAARNDYLEGFLFSFRSLIEAEILGDFVTQAEHLVKAGFIVPAASLLGAVLEDSLRKLSKKHDVTFPASTKLETLNIELAKAGIYDKHVQKRITALGDIRNNADHGHFDKIKKEDVIDMEAYISRFMADYLT